MKDSITQSRNLLVVGLATLTAACAIAVYAQDPGPRRGGPPGGREFNPLDRLTARLGLSGAQQAQVQPVLDAAKPQLRAIHEEARARSRAVMDDVTSKVTPFLTPEQQETLRSAPPLPGPGGPRAER